VNLHFLQPEAYSFHVWCEKAFIFFKNRFIKKQTSPTQMRKSKGRHYFP